MPCEVMPGSCGERSGHFLTRLPPVRVQGRLWVLGAQNIQQPVGGGAELLHIINKDQVEPFPFGA